MTVIAMLIAIGNHMGRLRHNCYRVDEYFLSLAQAPVEAQNSHARD